MPSLRRWSHLSCAPTTRLSASWASRVSIARERLSPIAPIQARRRIECPASFRPASTLLITFPLTDSSVSITKPLMRSTPPGSGPASTTIVGCHANDLGLDVTHTTGAHGLEYLRARRNGEAIASRLVERFEGRAIGGCISFDRSLNHEQRGAIRLALDEGVRVLRDGQSLGMAS